MQMLSMLLRLGMRELVHPGLEQRPRVVWARPRLGMELQRAGAELRQLEALDRPVVERDVRHLARFARLDGEAVVLARDEHPAGKTLEHRVVRAPVAERELVRLVASRAGDQLVPEADPEHVRAAEQVAYRLGLDFERLRVAGARREEDAVVAGQLVRAGAVRMGGDGRTRLREPAQDRVLDAVVLDRDPGPA